MTDTHSGRQLPIYTYLFGMAMIVTVLMTQPQPVAFNAVETIIGAAAFSAFTFYIITVQKTLFGDDRE